MDYMSIISKGKDTILKKMMFVENKIMQIVLKIQ